jgi:nanoRNase/pAp phosphatase (c-di-AMP/oligoRNAs hydrolase)
VSLGDTLGILINADPNDMASAMALKRFLWRNVKNVPVYHFNSVKRADNLAFIKLLRINQLHIRKMERSDITKWAILDSQPHHYKHFIDRRFDIIIDHHPAHLNSKAGFTYIREDYGANSTIMTEYLRPAEIKPSPTLATALFKASKQTLTILL